MVIGVIRCEELESEVRFPRKPIGRPGTNGSQVREKEAFLRNLHARNMNRDPKHIERAIVVQEYCLRCEGIQREV